MVAREKCKNYAYEFFLISLFLLCPKHHSSAPYHTEARAPLT